MAEAAKIYLEQKIFPLPDWIKSIEISYDDHGWYLTTKINDRKKYVESGINIQSTIEINGFKLKNCIVVLG